MDIKMVWTLVGAAWQAARSGASRVRASVAALLASPSVWLACGLVFVGGFWLGHVNGAHGKRALRAEVADLAEARSVEQKEAAARISALVKENADLRKPPVAAPEPAPSPVAAVSPRPRHPAPRAKPAAPAAPAAAFWPFSN